MVLSTIENQLKVAQAVIRIARLFNKAKGLDTAIEKMMNEFIDLACADEGSIQLLRPASLTTRFTLIRKETNSNQLLDKQLNDFLSGCVLKEKQAVITHDLSALLNMKKLPERYLDVHSILAAPLQSDEEIIGVVNLIRYRKNGGFTPTDLQIVAHLSRQIGEFIDYAEIREKLFEENKQLKINLQDRFSLHGIIGSSPAMKDVFELLERIIPTDARVVIEGESGTGKELIAKCIHYAGPRSDGPFVAVDCGALPPNLLESELFGYVKGAFTGAMRDRTGLLEEANLGTLFLDEFTNMRPETQAKLLRVIQEEEVRPLGSNQVKKLDVRIIVAASSNLREQVSAGKIRSDLFYRLNVVSVCVPPLRNRQQDIPVLTRSFLKRFASKHVKSLSDISPKSLQILEKYSWPGNIRELENVIERAVVMAHFDETILMPQHLADDLDANQVYLPIKLLSPTGSLQILLADYERSLLETTLQKWNWNQSAAAQELKISEAVMRYKIKRLGLKKPVTP
ncbi:MAG: GAF domain-containing protein [Calditrichaeota bacterium]|nr:MAG: GAF domain-containing protein [Calditrichota bacterium]